MGEAELGLPAGGQHLKRCLGKEDDVGRVVAIAPVFKALVTEHPLGLQHQQAAGLEAIPQLRQHRARLGNMLDHLGTGDKVILTRQQLWKIGVELVIPRHLVTRLAPHRHQRGAGTAAKIEATGRSWHPAQHLAKCPHQKGAITGIIHPVVVTVIDRLLRRLIQMIRLIQPDQLAREAAMIALARHRQGITAMAGTQGAADGG